MIRIHFLNKSDLVSIQLVRSILSSFVSFLIDFGILALLTELFSLHYLISAGFGFAAGTTTNYVLCIIWVFNRRAFKRKVLEYGVFVLIGAVGVSLNELFIWLFTEHGGLHYLVSKVISGSIVFFWNFSARKYILFRKIGPCRLNKKRVSG